MSDENTQSAEKKRTKGTTTALTKVGGENSPADGFTVITPKDFSLPAAPDAEVGMLALCLAEPKRAIVALLERLGPEGARAIFHDPANGILWETLVGMFDAGPGDGSGIDLLMVVEALREKGLLESVGGASRVANLVGNDLAPGGFSAGMMGHYLEKLIEKWQLREMWVMSRRLGEIALRPVEDRSALTTGVMQELRSLAMMRDRLLGVGRRGSAGSPSVIKAPVIRAIRAERKHDITTPIWIVCGAPGADAEVSAAVKALEEHAGERAAIGLDEFESLWADPESGLMDAVEDGWVVMVWQGATAGSVAAGPMAPEVLGGIRLIRDVVDRVTVLDVETVWPERKNLGQVLGELAATMPMDVVRRMLRAEAEQGRVPEAIWYEDLIEYGDRGGVKVLQDVLARRLMSWRRLLWAGGDFWAWGTPDGMNGSPGVWNRVGNGQLQVASWMRRILRREKVTLGTIEERTVKSITALMGGSRFISADALNQSDAEWINCRSGMINAMTGELRPHSEGYFSSVQVPLAWDPKAKCERWEEWLAGRLPDPEVRKQLQEIFGYCLVPSVNYHKFFFWHGDGGTGKSTAVNVLGWLVGEENVASLRLQELDQGFERGKLVGKSLYLCPEVTASSFKHIDMIKAITSGDPIGVDQKYRQPFTFRPRGRLVMTSNVVACTNDVTEGFARRLLQMNWDQVIPDSEKEFGFEERVLKPELPGIFLWAIKGFQRLRERGRFAHTEASKEAISELMRHRDQSKSFILDREWVAEVEDQGAVVTCHALFEHYKEWCENWGVKPYFDNQGAFLREAGKKWPSLQLRRKRQWIASRGEHGEDGFRVVVYRGLKLTVPDAAKGDEDDEEPETGGYLGGFDR